MGLSDYRSNRINLVSLVPSNLQVVEVVSPSVKAKKGDRHDGHPTSFPLAVCHGSVVAMLRVGLSE